MTDSISLRRRLWLALALFAGLAISGVSERTLAQPVPRPTLRASRLTTPPRIDGEVLAEELWQRVAVATGFVQVEPFEGEPASEKTEVRVAFDDQMLYVGIVCHDSEPASLAVSDSRRDADLGDEDSFRMLIDTFQDRQNGFVFGTNLAGIQYDGQVSGRGRSGGGGGSRGGPLNLDWDTSWQVRTRRGDFGWSAEFAIPFRSLRYGGRSGSWGLNFERNIRRKNELAYWAPLGRQFDLLRVSDAGILSGIETPKQRTLQLVPYALAQSHDDGVTPRQDEIDGGFDVKYGVTPSLTLDLTYNTDFAQVEVDDQQINLDRFALFFPEKRPFFLENAGLFKLGSGGGGPPGSAGVDLFFSRRIGISEEGDPVPIVGGARLSGRAGGMNVGLLTMQTDDYGLESGDNFTVGRLSREFPNRSRAGLMVVNREGTGSLAADDDHNRAFGFDGQVGLGQFADLSGWLAQTSSPGRDGRDHSLGLESSFSSPFWRWRAGYSEVGEDFNPEVGFVNRADYRRLQGFIQRRFRRGRGRIKELGPRIFYDSYWNFAGLHETQRLSLGGEIETRNNARLSFSLGESLEQLQESFEIIEGVVVPAGRYESPGIFLFLNSNRGRAVSFGARIQAGGLFNGDQLALSPSVNFRVGDYLSSELSWQHNDVDLDTGSFETNLGRLRVTYAFSTRVLLQGLVQYNDVTDDVSTNLRFSWLGQANTGLFLVYNEIREYGSLALPDPDRSIIVKYSRLLDVFGGRGKS